MGDEATRRAQLAYIEWRYRSLCLRFSRAYLETCDWYVGDSLRWIFDLDWAGWRKYGFSPLPVVAFGRSTPLEALWEAGLKDWVQESCDNPEMCVDMMTTSPPFTLLAAPPSW